VADITSLATLAVMREAIAAVEAPVNSLSKFVTTGTPHLEAFRSTTLEECAAEAIATLTGFADDRRVIIQFDSSTKTTVNVAKTDVVRAIANLLHNAIKYSWERDGRTWITVNVATTDEFAVLAIQNWGVPVPDEEIKRGLVFQLGFRGRLSSDRGRMGSGIGMTDSLAVAKAHHGRLRIESRPAAPGGLTINYKQPFLTTTYLEIPVSHDTRK
jgi:signal transduction histidine kinase